MNKAMCRPLVALVCVAMVAQATASGTYAPPRTPWGDPDLQGVYTNKYELGTPLERPKEFEGRRLESVTAAELSDVLRRRQTQLIDRPAGPGGSTQFRDVFELARGSRAWLIVDPPNGKIPTLRPDAQRRATPSEASIYAVNERQLTRGSSVGGPFNGPADFSLYDRCITRGLPGSMLPTCRAIPIKSSSRRDSSPSATN